jgi:hypothetical protein
LCEVPLEISYLLRKAAPPNLVSMNLDPLGVNLILRMVCGLLTKIVAGDIRIACPIIAEVPVCCRRHIDVFNRAEHSWILFVPMKVRETDNDKY